MRERQAQQAKRKIAGIGVADDSSLIACSHGRSLASTSFACSNLRWGIGTLPPQSDVYVPRRLRRRVRTVAAEVDPATLASVLVTGTSWPEAAPASWFSPDHSRSLVGLRCLAHRRKGGTVLAAARTRAA